MENQRFLKIRVIRVNPRFRQLQTAKSHNHINHSSDTGDLRAKGTHTRNFMHRRPLKGNLQESPRRPLKRTRQKQLRQGVRVCRRKHT